jgi:pseudouridine-5'-phosphate glycosidase
LGSAGLLLAQPPAESIEIEPLIEESLAAATEAGISGPAVTPFVLGRLHERSGGATVRVNKRLIADNAALAAAVAVAFR